MSVVRATDKQVSYLKTLYRKVKLYYKTLDDAGLVAEVRVRQGVDLDNLTAAEASREITALQETIRRDRGAMGAWR